MEFYQQHGREGEKDDEPDNVDLAMVDLLAQLGDDAMQFGNTILVADRLLLEPVLGLPLEALLLCLQLRGTENPLF